MLSVTGKRGNRCVDLHIEVGDDDLAEDGEQQPAVKAIILVHLVSVQSTEAIAESKQAEQEVQPVSDKECLLDSAH